MNTNIRLSLAELRDELYGTVEPTPVPKIEIEPHPRAWLTPPSQGAAAARRKAIFSRLAALGQEQANLVAELKDLS